MTDSQSSTSLAEISENLPLTLIPLLNWQLISVTGPDSQRYLQGQLTCDVTQLTEDNHLLGAHCDPKGKVWSCLRLLAWPEGIAYLQRTSVGEIQVEQLRKYAIFSKVTFAFPGTRLLAVVGKGAREALSTLFSELPDGSHSVVRDEGNHTVLLYFPSPQERFLLILNEFQQLRVMEKLSPLAELKEDNQWLALDIAAGLPVLDQPTSGQFIPQALNLHEMEAISFSKGCYSGQEVVARAKYRGINKRRLYWLKGQASRLPVAGEDLELLMGSAWRRTGCVLAACRLSDGSIWLQAVLNQDLPAESVLRVRDDAEGKLLIKELATLSPSGID